MCGIIWIKAKNKKIAVDKLLEQYETQKSRGTEGFGFCSIVEGRIVWERAQSFDEIKKLLKKAGNEIMFHHRFPTSTVNVAESAHPIKVSHKELLYDYYVIHNGVISNDDELHEKQVGLGYNFTTEVKTLYKAGGNEYYGDTNYNDSETLAIEVARYSEGLQEDITAEGSIVFMAYQVDKKTGKAVKMFYGRNAGNPLDGYECKEYTILASALKVKNNFITTDKLYSLDMVTGKTWNTNVQIGSYYTAYKGYAGSPSGYKPYASGYDDYDYGYNSYGVKTSKIKDVPEESKFEFELDYDYALLDELEQLDERISGTSDINARLELKKERKEILDTMDKDTRDLYYSFFNSNQ